MTVLPHLRFRLPYVRERYVEFVRRCRNRSQFKRMYSKANVSNARGVKRSSYRWKLIAILTSRLLQIPSEEPARLFPDRGSSVGIFCTLTSETVRKYKNHLMNSQRSEVWGLGLGLGSCCIVTSRRSRPGFLCRDPVCHSLTLT